MSQLEKLLQQQDFAIGDWHVSPAEGLISNGANKTRLEPKVMEVLVYLASRPQEVISREELERDVWHGADIGYDAVTATVIKLRKALGDNAREPRIIATIPKRGYQLIAPVLQVTGTTTSTALPVQNGHDIESPINATSADNAGRWNRKLLLSSFALLVFLTTVLLLYFHLQSQQRIPAAGTTPLANRLSSVVILPLRNLSGDPQQEYLSDGITEDITTALSQVAAIHVIAKQSAERYKNKNTNLQEVSHELGVNYVVEGSVQKLGNNIRINAQLTDVAKNQLVWAERFDRELKDVFAIQDEIARKITNTMLLTLGESENRYVPYRPTDNFEAYDKFLQAQRRYNNRTKEDYELTLEGYRRVLEIDPKFGRAYGAMAVTLTMGYRLHLTDLPLQESRERSLLLARKAVELDNNTPQVYWSLGYVHLFRREYREAEEAARKSITLSPSFADGYGLLAFIHNWQGKAKEAEGLIKKAMALNPYHSYEYPWNLGFSLYTQGRYQEAVNALTQALEKNETAYFPRLFLAASYVRLGRLEDANWEISQIIIQRPDTTISYLANTLPMEQESLLRALLADLSKAGIPK